MSSAVPGEKMVKLIECPRDAMQGWPHSISTQEKIGYLNQLLRVGFDTVDAGSFVSPSAVPQMADTADVFRGITIPPAAGRLLAIVANARGASEACVFDGVTDLGYPFSVSETFQLRNANRNMADSVEVVKTIRDIAEAAGKRLVVYISMAFGNPYGDDWSPQMVQDRIAVVTGMGIPVISLADTVGLSTPESVYELTAAVQNGFPDTEIGVHLHSRPENSLKKIEAAFAAGCRRFDGAIHGIGGCPMAGDDLVGNMDSLLLLGYFKRKGLLPVMNDLALDESVETASWLFL